MCGIAGIVNLGSHREVTQDELRRMNQAQAHRGPDADGVYLHGPGVGLAHVRLAILDLRPESNQPFHFPEEELVVVFNGEIFNYVELREELCGLGHHFSTTSDTEVLIKAYAQWGEAAVSRFNGMWAFALYDKRRQRLFCSRDRFGIKPFNYTKLGGRFLFASEIKSILSVAPEAARPDYRSLALILKRSVGAQSRATCFEGVSRLPPAHNLVVEDGKIRISRYWEYPCEPLHGQDEAIAARRLRELLSDAVRLRLRSDVPVGISLSSGLDSSAIARLVRDHHQDSVRTFTSVYEDEHHSEFPQAKSFAESLNMAPHPIRFTADNLLEDLKKILHHLESPHASPAVLPYWKITEAASRQVKVLLEGQGADELLAGYVSTSLSGRIRDLLAQGRVVQAGKEVGHVYRTARIGASLGSFGPLTYALLFARTLAPRWGHDLARRLRGDEFVYLGELGQASTDDEGLPDPPPGWSQMDHLNRSLVRQHAEGLVSLLHYGDAISMAHSLEARVPFLDYRLVEFCFPLPGSYKLSDGYGKAILRKALANDLPDSIIKPRHKLGFATPIEHWLRQHPDRVIAPVLFAEPCISRGLFDQQAMKKLVAEHVSGRRNHFSQIYRWISTELWFQHFIDRSWGISA